LLLVRLAFGEFAHAMPHDMSHESNGTADRSSEHAAGCSEHAEASHHGATHADPPSEHPQKNDCCKAAACECACLHASAILSGSSMRVPELLDRMTAITTTPGLVQDRLNRLFRPPA